MYEDFFGMTQEPFPKNVPPEEMYESSALREMAERLREGINRNELAILISEPGCGKNTLLRRLPGNHGEIPRKGQCPPAAATAQGRGTAQENRQEKAPGKPGRSGAAPKAADPPFDDAGVDVIPGGMLAGRLADLRDSVGVGKQ